MSEAEDPDGDPSIPPPEHGFGQNFGIAFGGATGRVIVHRVRARGQLSLDVDVVGVWRSIDASGQFQIDIDAIGVSDLDVQAPSTFPVEITAPSTFPATVSVTGVFDTSATAEGMFDTDMDAPGRVRSELFDD